MRSHGKATSELGESAQESLRLREIHGFGYMAYQGIRGIWVTVGAWGLWDAVG